VYLMWKMSSFSVWAPRMLWQTRQMCSGNGTLILCASLLVACGTSNSSLPQATDAGNGASAAYAAFCAQAARALCKVIANCCNITVDQCASADEALCIASGPDLTIPGATFNDSAAQSCISGAPTVVNSCAYISTSSSEYRNVIAACRGVVVGTLPVGSGCKSTNACAPQSGKGINCQADASGADRCSTYTLLNEGETCDINTVFHCASGLYCNITGSPSQCTQLKASGESCSRPSECISGTCTNSVCTEPTVSEFCQSLTSS
jgi:hypothetical protein